MNPFLIITIFLVFVVLLNMLSSLRSQRKEIAQLKNELQNTVEKNKQLEDQIEVMDMEMDLLEDIYKSKIIDIYRDETVKRPSHITF